MNVILFMDDQHNAGALGFQGHPVVKTPRLDELAARGTYFNRMFACSAICSPSRASFFTGTYVRTHEQVFNNGDSRRDLPSILSELKKAGYTTVQCGKSHLSPGVARNFDAMWPMESYWRWTRANGYPNGHGISTEERKKNFHAWKSEMPKEMQPEVWTANKAIDFIKTPQARTAPFFMWCSFERPHEPHCPPEGYDDMYQPDDIAIDWDEYRRFEASRMQNRPMIEDFWKIGAVRHDVSIFRKAVARYFALITLIDEQIGRVLDTLAAEGLDDETIVIFTSDHGDWAGRYGQLGKNLPGYDELIKIPFIYYDPQRKGDAGRVVEGMYQNVDLFPTLMERLGLEVPPTVQGRSFLPALDGRPGSGYEYVFAETGMEKTVRSADFKLTFFLRHPERGQLFRMGAVPNEIDNLWDDPNYRQIREKMLLALLAFMGRCEQPVCIDTKWEDHIGTRWYDWLSQQPGQLERPCPELTNIRD